MEPPRGDDRHVQQFQTTRHSNGFICMHTHHIGTLSPSGVLDVGLRCVHSCKFCYYSHWDGSEDQFAYMRRAPWKSYEELRDILDQFKTWGLTRFDVTGGEPILHPQLLELMQYAHQQLGLRARITTLAQFLTRPMAGRPRPLIEELADVGVREFLFSLHAVDPDLFQRITGASLAKMLEAMAAAERLGLIAMTNTVVNEDNFRHLVDIARHLADSPVKLVNYIVMKVEWGWSHNRDGAVERKARYSDLLPPLTEAVGILEAAGKAVNVRYGPYCAYRGIEKNLVGFKGVQLDPYEWRNGTRGGDDGIHHYGKQPFLFFKTLQDYQRQHPVDVETKAGYNMSFGEPCSGCAVRHICDGVDKDYVLKHGWSEFQPFAGEPITDLMHFRRNNPQAFALYE